MKKQAILILAVFIGAALFGNVIIGPQIKEYVVPQEVTISGLNLEMYMDDVQWANNTLYDWGLIGAGDTKTISNFTVANTGTVTYTVTVHSDNLPVGWSLVWSADGATVNPDEYTWGSLQLSTATDAIPGQTYSLDMWVSAAEV